MKGEADDTMPQPRISTNGKAVADDEEQQQHYQPEAPQAPEFYQQQYLQFQDYALEMENWATDIFTNFYVEPLSFNPQF